MTRIYLCFLHTIKSGSIPEEIENCSVFSMKEAEGRTFVIPKSIAENHGFEFEYPCRMITLQIHSSLSAVGEYTLRQKSIFGQVCICCSQHFERFIDTQQQMLSPHYEQ